MTHIKEPIGIDLNLKPMPLTEEDRQTISAIIASYKTTGEIPTVKTKRKTKSGKSPSHSSLRTHKDSPIPQ